MFCFFYTYIYSGVVSSHFGFDGQFILSWLIAQGNSPLIIPNGAKVMSIKFTSLGIMIVDLFNFLPMALAKLPACFRLKELKKGYFSHFFKVNKANQEYVGTMPDPSLYSRDSVSLSARETFFEWHAMYVDDAFNFQKEILEYCK